MSNALNPQEKQHLTRSVERVAALNAQIQAAKWEIKEVSEAAWEKCGVKPKVVKQLAKESAWDEVRREEQRQHEESLDVCRAALGMLADLPLGKAAVERHPTATAANGANGGARRGPGRPKGSRNKTRSDAADWARPPRSEPPVPDLPDTA